jgi:hypothetical protein
MSLTNPPYTQREIELANTCINVVQELYYGKTQMQPATQSVATLLANYRHEVRAEIIAELKAKLVLPTEDAA